MLLDMSFLLLNVDLIQNIPPDKKVRISHEQIEISQN